MLRFSLPGITHFGMIVSRTCQSTHFGFDRNAAATSAVKRLLNRIGTSTRCLCSGARPETVMNVFDRKAKRTQRNISALNEDYELYEYLRDEVSGLD